MSSLHFGSRRFQTRDQSSVDVENPEILQSVGPGIDEILEAERGEMVRHKHTRTESQEYPPPSNITLQDDLEAQPESMGDHHGETIATHGLTPVTAMLAKHRLTSKRCLYYFV